MIQLLFVYFTAQYGLPEGLLSSLCYVESRHVASAIHKNDGGEDSIGICQIKYSTAKQLGYRGSKKELYLPENNIKYAALYLKKQIKRYKSINRGVIAYNRGNSRLLTTSKYQVKVYKIWHKEFVCLK